MANIADMMNAGAQGWMNPCMILAAGGASAKNSANALSGGITAQILAKNGSTYPDTLLSLNLLNGIGNNSISAIPRFTHIESNSALLCRLYKMGTINMAATGAQWTHDAATFPILGTVMGNANSPLSLIPILYIPANSSGTAGNFYVRTGTGGGGGNGYLNENGTVTEGTVIFTMPAAAVNRYSCFMLRLNQGDMAVRDITGVNVTTATTGVSNAVIWGMEVIAPTYLPTTGAPQALDHLFAGGWWPKLNPVPVATAGNATVIDAIIVTSTGNLTHRGIFLSAYNKTV